MELCSQLNYCRSLSPGKAYFYYLVDGKEQPIGVDRTRIRAPKSGFSEGFEPKGMKPKDTAPQDLAYSNPQFIEECYVPPRVSEIYCDFSLRINANSLKPNVCALDETRQTLTALAELYKQRGGYGQIAKRIAKNILMGTWLWRNRTCRSLDIKVLTNDDRVITISNAFSLQWASSWKGEAQDALENLKTFIEKGLTDPKSLYYLDVNAKLAVGGGDEIYPSQEFVDSKQDGVPTKQLAKTQLNGQETVAFHAQKIGAALQMIDDWWQPNADKRLRVNEYGADREYVIARRHPKNGNDFYQLVGRSERWVEQLEQGNEIPDEVHFIMAVLVKAGVFNGAAKGKA
ncbi:MULTISPECIES: type I-F CRISPR-associated protein Csy3 [Echinimonadaceae]|uniref:Type I-F CRISPR-associated protein Csy3 n=2 Tax=Echinimonadaceae TaxID=3046600 RepID=A0A8J6QH62_9GAMM|nr:MULTISPECIES: type I-F CRISPR-associated protein Csy3 [Echinimonadaceae]MBD1388392.1 type I-F CRISPR-associated protein Csy3 [Neiella litorisoli]MCM2679794.1 type I-F CRISPR-associated protein Csy3 [Echinimonas agarilytica]